MVVATAGHLTAGPAAGKDYVRARLAIVLNALIAVWVFSGGFVITEPAPYELLFVVVLAVSLGAGFAMHRSTLGLLVLFVLFLPFALISAFQVQFSTIPDAIQFVVVTAFLLFTSYFVANYVAEAPRERLRMIMRWYIASAVLSALAGTLGYLGLIPGEEILTRYGRAKAFFNDPNVFAPYLILPAMYALQRVLLGTPKRAFWGGLIFMAIFIGVFASFSRAAWGHLLGSSILVFVLCFALEANVREKTRMLMLAFAGAAMMVIAIGGLLSIPAVQRLFEVRATAQNYDEGESGRFGRQGYAFELALAHPWGLGPLEFRNLRVKEEPHDTYVTVIHTYGWGGGLIFYVFIGMTIWRGVAALTRASPNRLLLIPLVAVFVPLSIEAAIIDIDHWRHFFLIAGLIWGVTASYRLPEPGGPKRLAGLI